MKIDLKDGMSVKVYKIKNHQIFIFDKKIKIHIIKKPLISIFDKISKKIVYLCQNNPYKGLFYIIMSPCIQFTHEVMAHFFTLI